MNLDDHHIYTDDDGRLHIVNIARHDQPTDDEQHATLLAALAAIATHHSDTLLEFLLTTDIDLSEAYEREWREVARMGGAMAERSWEHELVAERDLVDRFAVELARHGWGDFHYGEQPQDIAIVTLLDEHAQRRASRLPISPDDHRPPTVREVDGRLVIDWPDPRPRQFPITAEAFELLVARANKDHEMLVGLMLDIRAVVERWRRDELAIDVAFLEIAARLNTYDETITDA